MTSLPDSANISNTTGVVDVYTSGNDYQQALPGYVQYLVNGFLVIIITFNIPLLLVLFFTKVKDNNFVSVHILSLTLTDFGLGVSILLSLSIRIFNYWDCWTRMLLASTMYLSSIAQVATICLDRVLLFHNLKWKSITKNSTLLIKIIVVNFLTAFVITVIPFAVFATPREIFLCGFDNLFGEGHYFLMVIFGAFSTCSELFVILCTCSIIRFLWRRKRSKQRVNPHPTIQHQSNRVDMETRAMVTLFIIVVLFIILSTPINVLIFVLGITGEKPSDEMVLPFVVFSSLNSALNPIVYSLRLPEIREAFGALRRKMRCR